MRGEGNTLGALQGGLEMLITVTSFVTVYMALGAVESFAPALMGARVILLFLAPMLYSMAHRLVAGRGRAASLGAQISRMPLAGAAFFGVFSAVTAIACSDAELERLMLWWALWSAILCTALIVVEKEIIIYILQQLRRGGRGIRTAIVVTDSCEIANRLVRESGMDEVEGLVIVGAVGKNLSGCDCDVLGDFGELDFVLERLRPDFAFFAPDSCSRRQTVGMVNICNDRCVKVYFLPSVYGYFKSVDQVETFGSLLTVNAYSTPLDDAVFRFIKRAVDVVGAALLLILSSPIMLLAAIGVRLSSPGPILFKQTRVGLMGKPFVMLKFRSMVQNGASDTAWTRGRDPRKTRFGNFMRRTAIDELPQLFNVLRGEMSLVGPRPELPRFVEQFKSEIPLYMLKHYVKPGMTGLAQIRGLRGDTSIEDRIHADLFYIENWSLWLDLSILLQTPFRAFNKNEQYAKAEKKDKPDGRRVLYVASTVGHIDNFHLPYIQAMRARGDEVRIMARGEGADYDIPFEKRLLSVENMKCRRRIRRILKSEKFDAVILNTSLASAVVRSACPRRRRPRMVNVVHGYLFSENESRLRSCFLLTCERILRKRTDAIVTMNGEDRSIAEGYRLAPLVLTCRGMGAKVRSPISSAESLRRKSGCEDKFVLAFVGELSRRKNQAFLIRALPRLRERIPMTVLWLVGDGAEREALERLAGELGVSDSVVFWGYRRDACDLMRACDLYVSASGIEGMPFNVLEAMGLGKTVLLSAVKGHVDIVCDGVDGFLYKYGSVEDFVNKTCQILTKTLSIKATAAMQKFREYELGAVFYDTLGRLDEGMG